MIKKTDYFVLAGIIFVLCLAYLGILALTGFAKYWGVWRMIAFLLMTFTLTFWPLAVFFKIYKKINEPPTKKKEHIPVMKAETL